MFDIGNSLRQARQHRGLDLADVERETRIRARYLDALEEERFDVLPGTAYARGFLRTYAEFLDLDGSIYVDEFNERNAEVEDELPPIQHEPIRSAGMLRAARPLAGVVLALGATVVVVWQLGFTTASSGPQALPTTQVTVRHPVTAPATRPAAAPTTTTTAAPAPKTLVIHATDGDCWVQVRFGSSTGQVVYERTLAAGGTLRFGLARPLWVRLGAPSHVQVTVRGKPVTTLGSGSSPVDITAS